MAQRPVFALTALTAPALALALALTARVAAPAPATGSGIEVSVLSEGKPISGVVVKVRADDKTPAEIWPSGLTPLASDSTDAAGLIRFAGLAPGRYVVAVACERLAGDWIGGSASTVVEVLARRPARATLTMRRGGHMIGQAPPDTAVTLHSTVRMETPSALSPGCPIIQPDHVDANGRFEVAKIPIGTSVSIKLITQLGEGELLVWRDFQLERPDTARVSWEVPPIAPANLGKAVIVLHDDNGKVVHKGTLRLSQTHYEQLWRHDVTLAIPEKDSLAVASALLPGHYIVRASPEGGTFPWWTALAESLSVEAGKTTTLHMTVRLQKSN